MDSINTTDIAVASSPGAAVTLISMCHLFGLVKEWLQEGGVSTDSAIVSDSDMIVQRENMFSRADCKDYRYWKWLLINDRGISMCADNSLLHVTRPERLSRFTVCITYRFMTEMGASDSCSHDSVRSHIDTTVHNTNTLLSKDRHFHNFLVDTLDAGNICQATHDTSNVTISDDNCNSYRYHYGGSKCTYDTPRTDNDSKSYEDCLTYRFLKSLGADIACRHRETLVSMCHLFGFMKELLQEGGVSTDSAIVSDSDMIVQRENMFSQADCEDYDMKWRLMNDMDFSMCEDNSLLHVTRPERLSRFTWCITYHFMTEMGASDSCSHDSVRSHIDTTVHNTNTLLSKDRHFYNFMVDTLDAGNICQATHDTSNVTMSDDNCYQYRYLKRRGGSKCTHDTPRTDSDKKSYWDCLPYRFMKNLGADSVCTDWTLLSMCSLFGFMKEWLQEGGVSTDSAIVSDSDMIVQRENMFSPAECEDYRYMEWRLTMRGNVLCVQITLCCM